MTQLEKLRLPLVVAGLFVFSNLLITGVSPYRVGVGRADCTGPPVEIGFVSTALECGESGVF